MIVADYIRVKIALEPNCLLMLYGRWMHSPYHRAIQTCDMDAYIHQIKFESNVKSFIL